MSDTITLAPAPRQRPAAPPALSREAILAGLPEVLARVAEGAAERERARHLPHELFAWLRTTGLTWLRVPESLGGPGGTLADQVEVTVALASADSNVAHALRSHFGFLEGLATDPTSARSRAHAPQVLAGRLFGGAHMEIGTPRPNQLRTKLTREGDHFRLNGTKYYATGAIFADFESFSAVGEDGQITHVLIPADRPGLTLLDDWDGMGQTLSASGTVLLDNVEVRPGEVAERNGHNPFRQRHGATRAQLHLVAVMGGILRNVLADAISYTTTRARSAKHSSSATAAGDPFVQQTVGDLSALVHITDLAIADVARRLDLTAAALARGESDPAVLDALVLNAQLANSKAQVMVGRLAQEGAQRLFDTGGGSATSITLAFDRHWRNVRTLLNHNPALLRGRVLGDFYLNGERADFDEGRVF
ncbi:MAG TPA: acyl-CoA dehydrogenase family protein [Novosphingobium sp.]|nr:acyl-CoA dehydrogenase family protein [Novosphingobium sp.]HZV08539.1 acyl-CoA dehydrogenase family protein [Novosphingobium sp.]